MRDTKRQERHQTITEAAYHLLAERGYAGASMLNIAKRAKASNETLYRWYGDKRGLFEAMVRDNAEGLRVLLEQSLDGAGDPVETLDALAPLLLETLLGDRAILLNRAAAGDPTGELGAAIAEGGRKSVVPLIANVMAQLPDTPPNRARELSEWYVRLLIGDLQARRITGAMPRLSALEVQTRVKDARRAFHCLMNATA